MFRLQKKLDLNYDVVVVLFNVVQYFDIGDLMASLNESGSGLKKLKLLRTPTPETPEYYAHCDM